MSRLPHRNGLTERELEIVETYIDAGTSKETARRLGIAEPTVKNMMWKARQRVGAKNTVDLVYRLVTGEFDRDDD